MSLKTRNTDRSESDIVKSLIPLSLDEMDSNFLYLYDILVNKWTVENVKKYGDLETAVLTIGTSTKTILAFYEDQTLSNNLIIEDNIDIIPMNGAVINHGNYTITYKGSVSAWKPKKIFNGTGAVSGFKVAYPEWFGIDGISDQIEINKAYQALDTYGILKGSETIYTVDDEILADKDDTIIDGIKIKFKNYASLGTVATFSGIVASGDRMIIRNCYVDGNRFNQTWLWNGSANYGISVTGHNCSIENNFVTDMTANSMGVPTIGTNNRFIGNTGRGSGKKGFYGGNVKRITVSDNFFYDNENDAGIGLRASGDVIISGNHVYNNYYGVYTGDTSLDAGGGRVIIDSNVIYDNQINNIHISKFWDVGGADESSVNNETIITNNQLYYTTMPAINSQTPTQFVNKYNIEIYNGKNTTINGNQLTLGGVQIYNGINTMVVQNNFRAIYTTEGVKNAQLINIRGINVTGSHVDHRVVLNTIINNNLFETYNVLHIIDSNLSTNMQLIDNMFIHADSVTADIRIRDASGASTSTIRQRQGRIMIVSTTYTDGYDSSNIKGAGAPTSTPLRIGDTYNDTTNKKRYAAFGTASSADWVALN